MKRKFVRAVCTNAKQRKAVNIYENLGSRIRKGLYEGIGEDHSLLHGQFDPSDGTVDPLFQFRHPDVGVDKFERAVKAKSKPSELRSNSAETANKSASDQPAATPSTPVENAAPSPSSVNNNAQKTE